MGSLERELRRRKVRLTKFWDSPEPKTQRQKSVERFSALKAEEIRAVRLIRDRKT